MIYFVTCGRGFENYVAEELKENFNEILLHNLDEGKLLFSLENHEELKSFIQCKSNSSLIQTLFNGLSNHKIFSLKLIEKVFLLISTTFLPKSVDDFANLCKSNGINNPKIIIFLIVTIISVGTIFAEMNNSNLDYMMLRTKSIQLYENYLKIKELKPNQMNENMFHTGNYKNVEENTYRISSRVRGKWKKNAQAIRNEIEHFFSSKDIGVKNHANPDLDIYVHLNDNVFIAGEIFL